MAGRRRGRYPPEYKERIVELVRAGRSPGSVAREFEPSAQTIRNWVKQQGDEGAEAGEQAAQDGAGHPKKSSGLVREGERIDPRRGYAFMKANRAVFPLVAMCRVLGLSPSGLLRAG